MKKTLLTIIVVFLLGIALESCGATKRGCDGKIKHRVEMGWM